MSTIKNVPDKIYLQIGDAKELSEVTWCTERIERTDIVYYHRKARKLKELKAEIATIVSKLDSVSHSPNFKFVYDESLEKLRQLSAV